ncbi:MAG: pimelyl-ACP methyl ester esterase BioV [Campylobacterota bacterium]|nr:pimelyl-ACP methyl ester esterase BioV [Campylobacterota bacterium]
MKLYFNGFCLHDEQKLFSSFLIDNDFTVSGFSFGAQKALEYVLNTSKRVDTLQLFSPAYFNDKDEKYKRLQLIYFNKDAHSYCMNFLDNCTASSCSLLQKYFKQGSVDELEALLNYFWDKQKLQEIVDKGINIEVYLGLDDKIIDTSKAKEFFLSFATIYTQKNKGHIL